MSNPIAVSRQLVVFSIVLPVAAVLGYLLTSPDEIQTWVFVGLIAGALSIPFLLKWHRPLLLASWNSGIIIFFLPGTPQAWMLLALISLGFTFLGSLLNKEQVRLNVPTVTWSLLFLCAVVLMTAKLTGGLGLRSLGGSVWGGRKYYYVLLAVLAYFAISLQQIPKDRAELYTSLYLLGGACAILSHIIYFAGPKFYFLYYFFPTEWAISQAVEEATLAPAMGRLGGASWAGMAVLCYLLLRYGVRGLVDLTKWWRLLILIAAVVLGSMGGFRSVLIFCALVFCIQYYLEGLLRTKLTVAFGVVILLTMAALIPFSERLPISVQRSISFLPLNISPLARYDAQASTEWRLKMWSLLMPEIPMYFWLGKGYTASPTDYYLAQESVRRGLAHNYDIALIAGDYHSGPLSLQIPFGIWGTLGFCCFALAGLRLLYYNYRYGDPDLKHINRFLLAIFLTRIVFFITIFGSISTDLVLFTGICGLSVAINGGLRKKQVVVTQVEPARETVKIPVRPLLAVGR